MTAVIPELAKTTLPGEHQDRILGLCSTVLEDGLPTQDLVEGGIPIHSLMRAKIVGLWIKQFVGRTLDARDIDGIHFNVMQRLEKWVVLASRMFNVTLQVHQAIYTRLMHEAVQELANSA